jgi:polysaccharide biosynthesis transport protein
MANFRVRTPAEYVRMLWKRKFYIIVPAIIVTSTLMYVIKNLPDVYKSEALILVEQSKVNSASQAPQVDITSRLGTIKNLVTSRTSLKEIIENFGLYRDYKNTNVAEETILEEMRKHIDLQTRTTGGGANAFTIEFRGSEPGLVREVTAELTRRFIDTHAQTIDYDINRLMEQLDNQLAERKKRLEEIEAERAVLQRDHPEVFEGNDKTITSQINSLTLQMQSLRSSADSLANNISMMETMKNNTKNLSITSPNVGRERFNPNEGPLMVRLADLKAALSTKRKTFKDKHPEIQELTGQIEAVEKQLQETRDTVKKEEDAIKAEQLAANKENPALKEWEIRIEGGRREYAMKQNEIGQIQSQISSMNARLEGVPALQASVQKIERDYLTLQKDYEGILKQRNDTKTGTDIARELGGNTFKLQDAANTPEKPSAPQRSILYGLSLLLGLASGLAIAMAMEARSLFTIQDARDVEHYMHLPLLVTIPQIVTDNERRQRAMLRLVQVAGVILLILVAIPVLVTVLQRSRVLNIFAGVY